MRNNIIIVKKNMLKPKRNHYQIYVIKKSLSTSIDNSEKSVSDGKK